MKHATGFVVIALAVIVIMSFTTLAVAQRVAGPNRPAIVPADYVITPFGYFHPSCVMHLAKGDVVLQDEKAIQHANGTSDKIPVCAYPHYEADGVKITAADKQPPIGHAWVEYASVTTTSSYAYLYAEWSVPPAPSTNDGQTLYFFPGLEDNKDVVTIIQPVLGWNSDYPSAWGIASWNCCESGTVVEGTSYPAKSGDTILGYMFDTCSAGTKSCSTWDIVTWDLQSGNFSELINTSSFGQTFNWAFGGVLEVYNVVQCGDYPYQSSGYPGSNAISFNELGLFNAKLVKIANPAWKVYNESSGLTPQCSYGGSLPKQVILTY